MLVAGQQGGGGGGGGGENVGYHCFVILTDFCDLRMLRASICSVPHEKFVECD